MNQHHSIILTPQLVSWLLTGSKISRWRFGEFRAAMRATKVVGNALVDQKMRGIRGDGHAADQIAKVKRRLRTAVEARARL